jgi:hypothetical protein
MKTSLIARLTIRIHKANAHSHAIRRHRLCNHPFRSSIRMRESVERAPRMIWAKLLQRIILAYAVQPELTELALQDTKQVSPGNASGLEASYRDRIACPARTRCNARTTGVTLTCYGGLCS